ncbi:MAG TPA: preprotein translocase subunit YajC [candidate division WOR-3 bacterium]|uniref:Preprotein translocase subunit YajC n=1 Tax=candidate division WOR-3 bacterium TaxID=2052148 RepID=A0A9C9K0M8_UNCW3|nr:preprotein translocase subunit YajC [candidate division WOR-3 bacterium]
MFLFLFQQTCEQSGQQQSNPLMSFLPLILIFVVFYFLLILPQQKKQKQHRKLLEALKKDDRVVTSSGIYGTIANVKERTVMLVIADGVKIEIEKGHIVNVLNKARDMSQESK